MFVKKSIVEQWYQTDSWVYKNFSYLFQNPVWNKSIPKGFSVCPYFWLSLFSLFILRPFVIAPIKYVIFPLFYIFKPFQKLDEWLFETSGLPDYKRGLPTLAALAVLTLIGLLGWCVKELAIQCYYFWAYVAGPETGSFAGRYFFWNVFAFTGLLSIIGIHKVVTYTECKTHYYLYPYLLLTIIGSIIFVPSELGGVLTELGSFIWTGIGALFWVIGNVFKWIGSFLWKCITWAPIFGVSWVFILLGGTVLSYILSKVFTLIEPKINITLSEESQIQKNRREWIAIFKELVLRDSSFRKGKWLRNIFANKSEFEKGAIVLFAYEVFNTALESYLNKNLDILQKEPPKINRAGWDDLTADSYVYWGVLSQAFENNIPFNFDINDFTGVLQKVVTRGELRDKIQAHVTYLEERAKEKQQKKEQRKNTWTHRLCLKTTETLKNTIENFVFKPCKQIGIFFVYLWTLIKAKKQGACPFFYFQEPVEKSPEIVIPLQKND